jgi:hypothetical protein
MSPPRTFAPLDEEIAELHRRAAEARELAATFSNADTVRDLEKFAQSLDRQANGLEMTNPPLDKAS